MIFRRKNEAHGFTLIELIVVVLLLSILSVVALPRLFDQNQFAARGFFDDTVTAVRFAQKLALSSGCDVQVSLSSSGYDLRQRASCDSGAFSIVVASPANRANAYQNTEVAGLSLPTTSIIFDEQGLTASDSTIVLSGASASYSFRIYAETGLVEVI